MPLHELAPKEPYHQRRPQRYHRTVAMAGQQVVKGQPVSADTRVPEKLRQRAASSNHPFRSLCGKTRKQANKNDYERWCKK
jgi:hypothetical protein